MSGIGFIEKHHKADDFMSDMYRAAGVKEFELVQEQSAKLLRERPAIKDLFRDAARRGLIQVHAAERWLGYCGNRNDRRCVDSWSWHSPS